MAHYEIFENKENFKPVILWLLLKREAQVSCSKMNKLSENLNIPAYYISKLLFFFSPSVVSDSLSSMECSVPGFPLLHCLPQFAQTHCPLSRWCHPTISSSVIPPPPPAFSLSQHKVFSNKSALPIRPKYWSFSFSICPSNVHSGLISFRILQAPKKALILSAQPSLWSNSHIHIRLLEKL